MNVKLLCNTDSVLRKENWQLYTTPSNITLFCYIISDLEVTQQRIPSYVPWRVGRRYGVNLTSWALTWRTRRTSCPPPPWPCPAPPPSSWLTSADSTPQLLNSRTRLHGKLSCGAWSQIQSPSSTNTAAAGFQDPARWQSCSCSCVVLIYKLQM